MILKLLLFLILTLPISSYADVTRIVESIASTDSLGGIYTTIATPSQNVVYTKSFSVADHQLMTAVGVMYKATSSGTINLTIIPQQSWARPSLEYQNDTSYVDWDTPATTNDNSWRATTLDTVMMPYGRFKIIGGSGNDSTTTVQIKVGK